MTSLNPVYTIGRQMDEMLQLHTDLDEPARRARCIRMLEDVGISEAESRLDAYPHQFSGGMRQRVVIAIALLAGSRLIIADEPTTALDVTVQSQILKLMRRQISERGAAMILDHPRSRRGFGNGRPDRGSLLWQGGRAGPHRRRNHPSGSSIYPRPAGQHSPHHRPSASIAANPRHGPDIRELGSGCSFRERCFRAQPLCAEKTPELAPVRHTLDAACHFPLEETKA